VVPDPQSALEALLHEALLQVLQVPLQDVDHQEDQAPPHPTADLNPLELPVKQ